jgi:glycerophosphoryl diester phosphodiesterase
MTLDVISAQAPGIIGRNNAPSNTDTLPLVIGHRGFPAMIPEETIRGYQAAVNAGTDYLEMDIVVTKDGVPVLRHDLTLDDSTDVALHPEFAGRNKTRNIPYPNGTVASGFFVSDFTLAEIRTLNMTQVFAWRDQSQNFAGNRIVTLDEILEYGAQLHDQGKKIGLYIETKGVEYHDQVGLGLEDRVMSAIAKSRVANYSDKVIILQSFELASLPKMAQIGRRMNLPIPPLVYLLDQQDNSCQANITDAELKSLPGLGVNFIGPWKDSLVGGYDLSSSCNQKNSSSPTGGCTSQANQTCTGRLKPEFAAAFNGTAPWPKTLVDKAHELGIGVHAYTFRSEGRYMALDFTNDPLQELAFFGPLGIGLDGYFGDSPRTLRQYADLLRYRGAGQMKTNNLTASA